MINAGAFEGMGLELHVAGGLRNEWDLEMGGHELRKILKLEQEGERALDQRLSLARAQVFSRLLWRGLVSLPKECNIPLQAIGSQ